MATYWPSDLNTSLYHMDLLKLDMYRARDKKTVVVNRDTLESLLKDFDMLLAELRLSNAEREDD